MFTKTKSLPEVLSFSEVKCYVFSAIFVGLAVFVPWATHQFHLAGQIFLPMHFFVMFAGFLFGWRTGILVGVLSPLMSYSLTQMPISFLLPQVTLELAVYGFVIGFLRGKKLNIWVALFSAMILGRLARVLFMLVFAPQMELWQFIQISAPGIILQMALIPVIVYLLQKSLFKNEQRIR